MIGGICFETEMVLGCWMHVDRGKIVLDVVNRLYSLLVCKVNNHL